MGLGLNPRDFVVSGTSFLGNLGKKSFFSLLPLRIIYVAGPPSVVPSALLALHCNEMEANPYVGQRDLKGNIEKVLIKVGLKESGN